MALTSELYPTNKYQTPITESLIASLHPEVREWFLEAVNTIPFVKRLISPDRKYAKDLERDVEGKIVVDITNPHILENMEYFIPARLHYEKHGVYTFLRPNSNPNSEYYKYLKEEIRRCLEGFIRPSDGEWITGDMYFQLNYSPMMVNKTREGTNIADRVEGFPDIWEGLYWRHHYIYQARFGGMYNDFKGGNHGAELAKRGCGKSYFLASMMAKRFVLGESKHATKRVITILTAYLSEYLADKDGTLTKFVPIIDRLAKETGFPKLRITSSMSNRIWKAGYKEAGTEIERGSLNTVMGVSVKDDEAKLRGKRGYIFIEEFGSFKNLLSVYNNIRPGVEDGDKVFGIIYLVGTSGDSESDFYSAQELMYHPKGYNIYALPNVYDKETQGKPFFSFFFPAYINRSGCYNKDGVSDVVKALIEIYNNRLKSKYNTSDINTIIRVTAELPVTPQEAILKVKANIFPVQDLTDRLSEIESNPSFYDSVYSAKLIQTTKGVEYEMSHNVPIREFPIQGNNVEGAIEIYNMPERDNNGNAMRNRYIMGIDPYDNDDASSSSLGSILVLDLFTDDIVAEYTGRPMYADDFFEIARRIALFYNARINYENNKKGLYAYFSKMNSLHLLEDTLQYLKDKQILKAQSFGNSSKGVVATAPVNAFARTLVRDWLLKPYTVISHIDGEEVEHTRPTLFKLKGKALIKELIHWNSEANFDRVSALMMLMLYREEFMVRFQGDISRSTPTDTFLSDDPFFQSNYEGLDNEAPIMLY